MKEILEKRGREISPSPTWYHYFHFVCIFAFKPFFYKCPHIYMAPVPVLTPYEIQRKDHFPGLLSQTLVTPSPSVIAFLTPKSHYLFSRLSKQWDQELPGSRSYIL